MALWEFLDIVFRRYGFVFNLDAWYFSAIQAIGFLSQGQIIDILRSFGHAVLGDECGLTMMVADGRDGLDRSVPQVWIAEPSSACPVSQLPHFLEHELRHVLTWIRDGLQVWPGH